MSFLVIVQKCLGAIIRSLSGGQIEKERFLHSSNRYLFKKRCVFVTKTYNVYCWRNAHDVHSHSFVRTFILISPTSLLLICFSILVNLTFTNYMYMFFFFVFFMPAVEYLIFASSISTHARVYSCMHIQCTIVMLLLFNCWLCTSNYMLLYVIWRHATVISAIHYVISHTLTNSRPRRANTIFRLTLWKIFLHHGQVPRYSTVYTSFLQ